MSQPSSGDAFEAQRRRIRFRAIRRGTREMDLILGRFADAELDRLAAADLDAFEALLDLPEPDVQAWIMGHSPIPPGQRSALLTRLIAFHRNGAT